MPVQQLRELHQYRVSSGHILFIACGPTDCRWCAFVLQCSVWNWYFTSQSSAATLFSCDWIYHNVSLRIFCWI